MHFAPPTCNQLDHVASSLTGPSLSARVCCLFVNGAFGVWELDSRNELRAVGCRCLFVIADEDLCCMYLAHHELESKFTITIVVAVVIVIIITITTTATILITGHAFRLLSGSISVDCMHSCVLCAAMSILCILRSILQ